MTQHEANELQRRCELARARSRLSKQSTAIDPVGSAVSSPKSEQVVLDELHPAPPRTNGDGSRYAVVIISHRTRLIDPDNLCGKNFVDSLRRAGIIPDDTAAIMDYSIRQQKAKSKKEQFTEIEITRLT